ncbi:hypothetical protein THAOC_09307 [Thalassiosira oceanica]|uniref:Uncharacterized protein n=1 Tax=Thalassiosira oceanica TaxID=159749 RepID=K0SSV3_THAOC|nr:hypothetical protein THAOC_09307 [Thalassiosira oceanica]|eukprot:EJK69438.1 hypothetical protein THAOC_09307 [Thalassiosira oceanica]
MRPGRFDPRTVDRTDEDEDGGDGEGTAPETNPYVVRAVAGEGGGAGSHGGGGNAVPRCPRSPRSAVSDAPVFQLPDGTTGPTSEHPPPFPPGGERDLDTLGSLHGISALPDRGNIVTRSDGSVVSAITLDSRVIDVDSERRTRAPKRSEKLREMQEKKPEEG